MKKLITTALCLAGAFGTFAQDEKEKVTVILEKNISQSAWGKQRQIAEPEYVGDPSLQNAFLTLHTRLQTMLVSSGRVNVKEPSTEIEDKRIYVLSYTLVQGRRIDEGGKAGGKAKYKIGINLQAWDYLTDDPLPELTRTVEFQPAAGAPEDVLTDVVRYLAFVTLEAISPVTILELQENKGTTYVSVDLGGEILRKDDYLNIANGLFEVEKALRVERTEGKRTICRVVRKSAMDAIKVGAVCRLGVPVQNNLSDYFKDKDGAKK